MPRTTVYGAFDHGIFGALERRGDHLANAGGKPRQLLWRIYAKRSVLAAGATERPDRLRRQRPARRHAGRRGARLCQPLVGAAGKPRRGLHRQRRRLAHGARSVGARRDAGRGDRQPRPRAAAARRQRAGLHERARHRHPRAARSDLSGARRRAHRPCRLPRRFGRLESQRASDLPPCAAARSGATTSPPSCRAASCRPGCGWRALRTAR